ncbi:hypothetical protein Tco_0363836 [Tanacetum coccineum]
MSLSLAENVIVAGADNRPPMLDKTQYSFWTSCMLLYIKGKENEKLLVDSVLNGPFDYGTVTEGGVKDMEVHFDMTVRQKAVFECLRAPHAQDFLLAVGLCSCHTDIYTAGNT